MRLYNDQNVNQFQKILELKGLKRAEQLVVIDMFQKKLGIQIAPINTSNSSQISTISAKTTVVTNPPEPEKVKPVEGKRMSNLFHLGKRTQ